MIPGTLISFFCDAWGETKGVTCDGHDGLENCMANLANIIKVWHWPHESRDTKHIVGA